MTRAFWEHKSTIHGDLPAIGPRQQTLCVVDRFSASALDEIIIGTRNGGGPALTGLRKAGGAWMTFEVEPDDLSIEAGGAAWDIDGDGWLDLVAGGDWQSGDVWWWQNPGPGGGKWQRHAIKAGGPHQHHDQLFGDFDGDGRAELVFWNQHARTLYWCPIPSDPTASPWPFAPIWVDESDEFPLEGLAKGDIDGDGVDELFAGNCLLDWSEGSFHRTLIDPGVRDPRILVADFDGDGKLEVVMAPADHLGRLLLWSFDGDPARSESWTSRDLLGEAANHSHTLQAADFNGDGALDILVGEMRQWTDEDDNPACKTRILFGDGKGGFTPEVLSTGIAIHEGKVGDFSGHGTRRDICGKPYCWQTPRLDLWLAPKMG